MFLCCPEAQACQPVAATFENTKPDLVKPKFLPRPWNGPAFKKNKSGDSGGIFIWQLPAKCAVPITNGAAAVDNP